MAVSMSVSRVFLFLLTAGGFAVPALFAKEEKPVLSDRYGDPLPPGALARIGTVRLNHGGEILGITFAPDGKTLASASADYSFRRWDVATGKELSHFEELYASAIAHSPDGRLLAGFSHRGIRLWEAATGREMLRIRGGPSPGSRENALAFSPDGKILAAVARRPDIRLYDTATGQDIREPLKGHQKGILSLSFSRDGKKIVSAGGDKTVRIWNVATGEELHRFEGHTDTVYSAAISPDGKIVVSGSEDKTVRLWDMASGKEIRKLEQPGTVFSVIFSHDGKTLFLGGANRRDPGPAGRPSYGLLQICDTTPEIKPRRRIAIPYGATSLALAPDGRALAVVQDHSIRLWDIVTGKEIQRNDEPNNNIHTLAISPEGRTVALGGLGESIRLCDSATGRLIRRFSLDPDTNEVLGVAFSPDGKQLASAGVRFGERAIEPRGFEVWDLSSGERTRRAPDEIVLRLAFSPDGKILATGYKEIKLWDATTGKELRRLSATPPGWNSKPLYSLAFSADGKLLAMLKEGKVVLWDVATGKEIQALERPDRSFGTLALSSTGHLLAIDSVTEKDRGTIHLWDIREGTEQRRIRLNLNIGWHASLAFTPDGRALAIGYDAMSGDRDRHYLEHLVQLWEVATGQKRREWKGHRGRITRVAFSPDGKRLVSSSSDTTALVWDVLGQSAPGSTEPLSPEQLQALWTDLAGADAAKAFDAIGRLTASPEQAVPMLKTKLRPVSAAGKQQVARLIADLDSDDFAVREKAMEQLRQLSERAELDLREGLKGKLSLESRKRIEELLEAVRAAALSPDNLRNLRAVEVLEYVGTSAAQDVLKTLAKGASSARLTREATASLERLARWPSSAK